MQINSDGGCLILPGEALGSDARYSAIGVKVPRLLSQARASIVLPISLAEYAQVQLAMKSKIARAGTRHSRKTEQRFA